MCFSATASFIASAGLFSVSAYIFKKAKPLDLASTISVAIPLAFSIQQATEGIIWVAINSGNQELANTTAIAYIFFAYLLWPIFTPIFGLVNEPIKNRKNIFYVLSIVGFIFGLYLYFPILMNRVELHPTIVGHSLSYLPGNYYSTIPITIDFALYLAICPLSLLLSSHKCIREISLIVLLAFGISYIFFYYALSSVWCFFAAIISLNVIRIEDKLKQVRVLSDL